MQRVCLMMIACALSLVGMLGCAVEEKNGDKKPLEQPAAKSVGKSLTVTMKGLDYDPQNLEIHAGDSVVWTNTSHMKHTATSDDDGKTFDTGEVAWNESSKPVKFETEGEFKYHCRFHGKSMSGTIVVRPRAK